MNDYYYSQRYGAYARKEIGRAKDVKGRIILYKMADSGCVITATAMILSYFNDRAFYPDQMLEWLKKNKGLTSGGAFYWDKLCEAAGGKLRRSITPNPKPDETTYGLRGVYLANGHYIIDHPKLIGKIIDPLDGLVKPYNTYKYTGYNNFYIGKVVN